MATSVLMRHPGTGITCKGFYGFSWTTLIWSGLPALFRGDLLIGVLVLAATFFTGGLAQIVWAFFYNRSYTTKLIERGYVFADQPWINARASAKLGIS